MRASLAPTLGATDGLVLMGNVACGAALRQNAQRALPISRSSVKPTISKRIVAVACALVAGVALAQSAARMGAAPIGAAGTPPAQGTAAGKNVEARVDALIHGLTLEEKIDLISGRDEFYTFAIPRLGIPALKMADGPMGVRNYGPSTAFPAGIALAATWDAEMAHRIGAAMGRDARARGVKFCWRPL